MVFYFTATVEDDDSNKKTQTNKNGDNSSESISVAGTYTIYMGKDKYENEELIKYGHPEDLWFHVDDLSSAHVYLRMKDGMTMDDVPEDLIIDCAALVKANSIQGCKVSRLRRNSMSFTRNYAHSISLHNIQKSEVYVVYTRWKNLKKTSNMVEGQVGYHRPENVRRIKDEKHPERVKQLNETKLDRSDMTSDDLYQAQQKRLAEIQRQKKQCYKEQQQIKQEQKLKEQQEKELRSYDRLIQNSEQMTAVSDVQASADASAKLAYEDDFF